MIKESLDHFYALPAGHHLAEYKICGVLGYGGFGITYLAEDTHLSHTFAIKEYLPPEIAVRDSTSTVRAITKGREGDFLWGRESFVKEARTMARFFHPNLVRVHRFFEAHNTAYIVMDYVRGRRFDEILDDYPQGYPADKLAEFLTCLLEVVDVIHEGGVVHRDIKPGNIIIRDDNVPVLLDFGAARDISLRLSRNITALVSSGYAPLEQYSTTTRQGPWTDIYALAAVAHRAITGEVPPDPLVRLKDDPLIPATDAGAGRYPRAFLKAVDWGLKLHLEKRPQSIAEWRRVLFGKPPSQKEQGPKQGPREEKPAPVEAESIPSRSWARPLPLMGAAVVVMVLALMWALMWHPKPDQREIVVDVTGAGDVKTIAEGVSRAKQGSTIRIRGGTYTEGIKLDKSVHLVGSPVDPQLIKVSAGNEPCLVSAAPDTSISGLSFRNESDDPTPCVEVSSGSLRMDDVEISSKSGIGLLIAAGAEAVVRRARIHNTGEHGIKIMESARATIENSNVETSGGPGVQIDNAADLQFRNNHVTNGKDGGVLVANGSQARFENNVISGNALSGILVFRNAAPYVADSDVSGNQELGIYIYRKGGGTYVGNRIVENRLGGIALEDSTATFQNNEIKDNQDDGVFLRRGSTGYFVENQISGNMGHGIAVDPDSRAHVMRNKVVKNKDPQVVGPASRM